MEVINKLPITKTLKALEIGGKAVFPIEQTSSVRGIRSKLKKELARSGWEINIVDDTENFTTTVVRIR